MPTKIGFWNAEHWSNHDVAIAERAEAAAKAALEQISVRGEIGPTRAITRSSVCSGYGRAKKKRARRQGPMSRPSGLTRQEEKELAAIRHQNKVVKRALRKTRKFTLARDMKNSQDEIFFCEVESTHNDAQSSRADDTKPRGLLCYASFSRGVSINLSHIVWPAAIAAKMKRVPKYRNINGTGQGGEVKCYFWHAPSGNNGQIVYEVYDHLTGLGEDFILFGDLNAEPYQLIAKGVPEDNIKRPVSGTRISGRTLDYAVTNVPNRVEVRKYNRCPVPDIKNEQGSDHAFMFLDLT